MTERLESVFATASDLISADDLDETLARITDRAAHRCARRSTCSPCARRPAPSCTGTRRASPTTRRPRSPGTSSPRGPTGIPRTGSSPRSARIATTTARWRPCSSPARSSSPPSASSSVCTPATPPPRWTTPPRCARPGPASRRPTSASRRAARCSSSRAAWRPPAAASRSRCRLADAVGSVVDCDRVSVFLWDDERRTLVRRAVNDPERDGDGPVEIAADDASSRIAELAERPSPEPIFIDVETSPLSGALKELGSVAMVAVPIVGEAQLLGLLCVSVASDAERLADSPELRDRLSGVAAHAVQALQNGRLDRPHHPPGHARPAHGPAQPRGLQRARRHGHRRGRRPPARRWPPSTSTSTTSSRSTTATGTASATSSCARSPTAWPDGCATATRSRDWAVTSSPWSWRSRATRTSSASRRAWAQSFDEPFAAGGHLLALRASIGRAVWPLDVATADRLLECADAAMYDVKHGRRAAPAALSG